MIKVDASGVRTCDFMTVMTGRQTKVPLDHVDNLKYAAKFRYTLLLCNIKFLISYCFVRCA